MMYIVFQCHAGIAVKNSEKGVNLSYIQDYILNLELANVLFTKQSFHQVEGTLC